MAMDMDTSMDTGGISQWPDNFWCNTFIVNCLLVKLNVHVGEHGEAVKATLASMPNDKFFLKP